MAIKRKKTLAELMQERAQQSTDTSAYTTNPMPRANLNNDTWNRVINRRNAILNDTEMFVRNTGLGAKSGVVSALGQTEFLTQQKNEAYRKFREADTQLRNIDKNLSVEEKLKKENEKLEKTKNVNGIIVTKRPEIKDSAIMQDFAKEQEEINKKIAENTEKTKTKLGKFYAGNVAPSMGQSLTGTALDIMAPGMGSGYRLLSYSGNYTQDALNSGMKEKESAMYGLTMGAVESAMDAVGDKLKGKLIGEGKTAKGLKEFLEIGAEELGVNSFVEGIGEALTEPLQEKAKELYGGKADYNNILQRMGQSFVSGVASELLMSGASLGYSGSINVINKIQNGEQVSTNEISDALKEINEKEEIDITKILANQFELTSQDLYINKDVQQKTNTKLENMAQDISKGEFKGIKNNSLIEDSGLDKEEKKILTEITQKYNLSEENVKKLIEKTENGWFYKNQATTIENKPISEQSQQVISNEGKVAENQVSQEISDTEQNEQNQIKIDSENFAKQVDEVKNGTFAKRDMLTLLSKTPKPLLDIGLNDFPITMTQKHLDTIMNKEGKNTGANYHNLGENIIKQLPEAISNPLDIVESNTKGDSIVLTTYLADNQDRTIIASIKIDGRGRINDIELDSNVMTSAYGRNNYEKWMQDNIDNGRLLYDIDRGVIKKATRSRLQLPRTSNSVDTVDNVSTSTNIIPQNDNNMQQKNVKNGLPQRRNITDEVYREDIAEGKTRKHYKSVFESEQVGEQGKEVAKQLYQTDTYTPVTNLETITDANDYIGRVGLENAYIGFTNKINSNEKIRLEDIALGERLIQIYSENGDFDKVNELIQDVAILGTELGQQVQAFSLIKKASPEGQLQYLQKLLNRTNIKEDTDIKITKDMTEKILKSKDAKELEDNMSKVAIEIANQIPLKGVDKIRAWRYLSMLGNPKTHIKNLGANLFMNITQNVKNKVAGGIESVVSIFNPNMERTKTLRFANKEQRSFAKQDAEEMADLIDAGGKYDVKNIIQQNKRQFDNKTLNAIAEFNSKALDWEDKIFLKTAYKQAMQGYMSANNLKTSDMTGQTLEKARQYASLQAQQATFHEFNAVANLISQLENKNKIAGFVTSSVLPFKKTPMNIAKAGFEYSAVGLGKSLTYDIAQTATKTKKYKQQLAEGKITQEQYNAETSKLLNKTIDNMAKGLTGSSIALIGFFLASKGLLKAGNDDEGDEFEEKTGKQEYSIQFGDNTYTLDWISPSAIPLFTGATIYQLATGNGEEKETAINSALTGFSKAFEPMTEMSMLQGLASAIASYEEGSSGKFFDLGASMITSYAGQFLPTAMGQIARTIDPYERDTSSTKKGIEGKADKFVRQSMNKLPGVSKALPTKKDVWGEDVKRADNWAVRYAENALLPWSRKEITQDRTDKELLSVFDKTGENVLPGTPSKDLTINGEKYRLTTEEYNKAKSDFGKTSKKIFDNLVNTPEYKDLTAEGKAKAIKDVYSYAKEKLKVDYAKKQGKEIETSTMYDTVSELQKQKGDISAYFEFKGKIDDLDRSNGDDKVKQKEKLEYLNDMTTDKKTKRIIYEDTFGSNDEVYGNLKALTGNRISIEDYLNYKTTEIKGIDDPYSNVKGATIKGSKKKTLQNFLENSNFSGIEMLYIYGTQNSFSDSQRAQFQNYVTSLNLNPEEEYKIYKKLNSIEELDDGTIRWK